MYDIYCSEKDISLSVYGNQELLRFITTHKKLNQQAKLIFKNNF